MKTKQQLEKERFEEKMDEIGEIILSLLAFLGMGMAFILIIIALCK